MLLRRVYRFLVAAFCVLGSSGSLADTFEIIDSEGFDREMVAKTARVPNGWRTSGRIAWNKPCSSNDLFETIFMTQSPDGRAGARIMPGYQFMEDRTALMPGVPADQITHLMLAQSEAFNREMASRFRGSNCAVGTIADTKTILDTVVLKNRPPDVRLVAVHRDEAGMTALAESFGPGIPGVQMSYDARIVEMQYARGGVPTTEWLFLSWYNFTQAPMDMGGVMASTSHTVVEPFRLVWAPTDQAQDFLPRITQIFSAIRSTPEWQRRIDDIYRKDGEARRKARAERDAESERRTRDFIDQIIWEGKGAGGGSAGSVAGGSSGGDPDPVAASGDPLPKEDPGEKKEETDFWGNLVEKTDFWGDPVAETD